MNMKVVSKFEYAIMQAAYGEDSEKLKEYRPKTDDEVAAELKAKAKDFASKIRIKKS